MSKHVFNASTRDIHGEERTLAFFLGRECILGEDAQESLSPGRLSFAASSGYACTPFSVVHSFPVVHTILGAIFWVSGNKL